MADIKVQRGTVTFGAAGNTTETLTAGTHYTAPAAASKAWCRITGITSLGTGPNTSDTAGVLDRNATSVDDSSITSSISFTRVDNANAFALSWELIEYTGSAGGANEFIVRHREVIGGAGTSATYSSAAVSGVASDADVVVFLAGWRTEHASRATCAPCLCTTSWDTANQKAVATRADTTNTTTYVSVAVVEFTGSAWTVQRVEHSFTASDTDETETISSVGDISQAFIHTQTRGTGTAAAYSNATHESWLSSATQVSFRKDALWSTSNYAVTWVIANAGLSVQRATSTRGNNVGSDPDSWAVSITAVSALDAASIMGECGTTTQTTDNHMGMASFYLGATDAVTITRGRNNASRTYRFEVVEWPSSASGVTGSLAVTLADISVSAAGALTVSGSASNTLAALGISASGAVAVTGSASAALSAATLSAAGAVAVVGTASPALAAVSLSGAGTVGSSPISGALSVALADVLAAASGAVAITGAAGVSIGSLGLSAAGAVAVTGSASNALGAASLAAAGVVGITGAAANQLGPASLTGAGAVALTGAAAVTLGAASLSGAGVVGSAPITGTLGVTLGGVAAAGNATVLISGALAQALASASLSGTGALPISGALSVPLGAVAVGANGALAIRGAASAMLGAAEVLADGDVVITGALAQMLASIALAASGREGSLGTLQALLQMYPALTSAMEASPALTADIDAAAALGATIQIR